MQSKNIVHNVVSSPPYSKMKSRLYIKYTISLSMRLTTSSQSSSHSSTPSFMWSQSEHSGAQLTIMALQGATAIWLPFATFPAGSPEAKIMVKPSGKAKSCFSKSLLLFLSATTCPPRAHIQLVRMLLWLTCTLPWPSQGLPPLLHGTLVLLTWDSHLFPLNNLHIMELWRHLGLPGIAVTKQCVQGNLMFYAMLVLIAIITWGLSVFVLSQ